MILTNNFNYRYSLNFRNEFSKSNISMRGQTKIDYDKYTKSEFEKLINEGKTYSEIKNIYDLPITTIRSILTHYGLKTKQAQIMENIDVNQVKKMIENGATQHEIAQHFGVSTSSMTAFFRKHKLQTFLNIAINSMTRDDWAKYLEKGYTIEQIANDLGVSTPVVSVTLRKFGLTNNTLHIKEKDLPVDDIINMYAVQKTKIKDISEKFDVPKARIARLLRKYGYNKKSITILPSAETLKSMLVEGLGIVKISKVFKISPDTVSKLIDEYGLQAYNKNKKYKKPDAYVLKSLVDERLSMDEIAEELDIPSKVVKKTLSFDELKPFTRKQAEAPRLHTYLLAQALYQGDSPVQIAEFIGTTTEHVKSRLDDLLVQLRNKTAFVLVDNYKINVSDLKINEDKKSPTKDELSSWIEQNAPLSYKEIAEYFNISNYSARYLCEKYNLENEILNKNC